MVVVVHGKIRRQTAWLKPRSKTKLSVLPPPPPPPITKLWKGRLSDSRRPCVRILSVRYLLNRSIFCNQTWYGGASSRTGVSRIKIGVLTSRSRPQWGFIYSKYECFYCIMCTSTEPWCREGCFFFLFEWLSWRVTCPNHASFRLMTVTSRGSCGPTKKLILLRTQSLVLCSH